MNIRRLCRPAFLGVLAVWAAWGAAPARGDWTQVGGSLNTDPNSNAVAPSMAMAGTTPWVTWTEPNAGASRIYVKYLSGGVWTPAGGAIYVNASLGPYYSNLGLRGGTIPSVGWIEYNYSNPPTLGYLRTWNGTGWDPATPTFNSNTITGNADSPTLVYSGITPYVAFTESGTLHVRTYNGSAWSDVGSPGLNAVNTNTAYGARIASNGTNLYVAWNELGAPFANWQTYVRIYLGGVWTLVGGALSPFGVDAGSPDLAIIGTTPYVAYSERSTLTNRYEIAVKYWSGSAWTQLGSRLVVDNAYNAGAARITSNGGVPYVTWSEGPGNAVLVYVRYWNGSGWGAPGTQPLNLNAGQDAGMPCIGWDGTLPYVAWYERNPANGFLQVYAKKYVWPTPTPTWSPTATRTATRTVTSTSSVSPTRTATPTATPTVTPTRSPTGTISPTCTLSPTRTPTPKSSPTLTPYAIGPDAVVVYPSPAKGQAVWFYFHARAGDQARLQIYNPAGERVADWTESVQPSQGYARLRWDLRGVAPGVYLYRLRVSGPGGERDLGLGKLVVVK